MTAQPVGLRLSALSTAVQLAESARGRAMEFPAGLPLLAFPIIAIVALVKTINITGACVREAQLAALELHARGAAAGVAAEPKRHKPLPSLNPHRAATAARPSRLAAGRADCPAATRSAAGTARAPAAAAARAASASRKGSAPAGWSGSAALRSRSAAFSSCSYSIEQGLIGPGVRMFFGALLAAALVAAGEWTRRQRATRRLRRPARPPHIPSILTAAGTTVAYATVYAAYALYGFLGPGARLRAARHGGASDARRRAAARPGAGGARPRRRLRDAAARLLDRAELLGALHLSRRRHGRRVRARAHAAVALAGDHRGRASASCGCCRASTTRASTPARMLFHVAVGFALAAALIVAGLFYGPRAEPGRIDPRLVGVLAVYLFGALPSWCWRAGHDPRAHRVHPARRRHRRHRLAHRRRRARRCRLPRCWRAGHRCTGRSQLEFAHLIAPGGPPPAPPDPDQARYRPASRARHLLRGCCSAPPASWRRAARRHRSSRSCGPRRRGRHAARSS